MPWFGEVVAVVLIVVVTDVVPELVAVLVGVVDVVADVVPELVTVLVGVVDVVNDDVIVVDGVDVWVNILGRGGGVGGVVLHSGWVPATGRKSTRRR